MASASFSCASETLQSGWVHGREQQQISDGVRGRSYDERVAVSSNCRAWRTSSVASLENCRLGLRLHSRPRGSGADFLKVRRIAAISRQDDGEFREGAEIDGDGGVGGETYSLKEQDTRKDVQVDLQLPRRRLLVEFTCNVCQTRTQRLVNPAAYKRGTVYVQCGGCETYHQLVDNLGLVVEYDFRKETDSSS